MNILQVCINETGTQAEVLIRGFGTVVTIQAWRHENDITWNASGVWIMLKRKPHKQSRGPHRGHLIIIYDKATQAWHVYGAQIPGYTGDCVVVGWDYSNAKKADTKHQMEDRDER